MRRARKAIAYLALFHAGMGLSILIGPHSLGVPDHAILYDLMPWPIRAGLWLGLGILALSIMEPLPFRELLFEAASALGTVGLSLGITAQLSTGGKIVLILLMFWGRVGIVTFLFGLMKREARGKVSYPDAEIPVG